MKFRIWICFFVALFCLAECLAESPSGVEQMQEAVMDFCDEDFDWVNWAVVVAHPGMIARHDYVSPRLWTNEEQLDFIKDFDPDHIECWLGMPFARSDMARSRGITVAGGMEYEWESGIHGVQYLEDAIFRGNGIGVKENGQAAGQQRYQTRGLTHMAPKWHHTVKAGSQRYAAFGDSLSQDNIIHGMTHPYGQFDDYANRFFLEYLKNNFDKTQLDDFGVDFNEFHIRRYVGQLRKTGRTNQELVDDPLIKEFIRFHYIELTRKMINVMNQCKLTATKVGRPVPAWYGNLSGMTSHRSFGVTLSQFVDVIQIERSEFAQPCHKAKERMDAFSTLLYKNGVAAGNFEKPVWSFTYDNKYTSIYRRISNGLVNAEALANGGVHIQMKRRDIPEGVFRDVNRHHAQIASQNRVFFTDRERMAKVGLLRSVPSEHWGFFSTLKFETPHLKHYGTVARILEDHHILYDVAILGHPDFFEDSTQLERLDRYDTLILPYVECVADYQIDTLSKWVRKGGKLVLWGDYGSMDEERNKRPENAFASMIEDSGDGTVVYVSVELAEEYRNLVQGAEEQIAAIVKRDAPLIRTEADQRIWFNAYRHGAGPMISFAMINYDIDPLEDTVTNKTNFRVSIKVDDPDLYQTAYYIRDNYKTEGADVPEMVELPFTREGSYLSVTIPTLDIFGVVAFAAADEFSARKNAAEVRKWHNRFKVAKHSRGQELTDADMDLLSSSEQVLTGIQGNIPVANFATMADLCRDTAARLKSGVQATTMVVIQKNLEHQLQNIWVDAEEKFDFGPADNVTHGWNPVTDQTVYTKKRGYGWSQALHLKAMTTSTSADSLHGDYVRSQDPREQLPGLSFHYPFVSPPDWGAKFRVDLPNGEYVVTVICGDEQAYYAQNRVGITYVDANGEPALYGDRIPMGFYDDRSFKAHVDEGYLELRFWGRNVGPLYGNNCDWLVNGLIIQNTAERLSTATQKSLSRSDLHDRAVVRDWSVIGPFDDKDCMGLDVDYPAEDLDLTKVYDGQAGSVQWQTLPQISGLAPTVHFSQIFYGQDGGGHGGVLYEAHTPGIKPAVALAATFVYVPEDTEVVLKSSSTQMAEGYVNGRAVFRSEYIAGVLSEEDSMAVSLAEGWNSIVLKTTCYWGDEWASWVSLYSADGKPLKECDGVVIQDTLP